MKMINLAVYTLLGASVATIGYGIYSMTSGKHVQEVRVALDGNVARYRVTTFTNGLITLALLTALPDGFDNIYHNHLVNATSAGSFKNIAELAHFIMSRHKDIKVTVRN